MFYQKEDKKSWNSPVKVIAHLGNSVFVMANGNIKKVADCKVQPCGIQEHGSAEIQECEGDMLVDKTVYEDVAVSEDEKKKTRSGKIRR